MVATLALINNNQQVLSAENPQYDGLNTFYRGKNVIVGWVERRLPRRSGIMCWLFFKGRALSFCFIDGWNQISTQLPFQVRGWVDACFPLNKVWIDWLFSCLLLLISKLGIGGTSHPFAWEGNRVLILLYPVLKFCKIFVKVHLFVEKSNYYPKIIFRLTSCQKTVFLVSKSSFWVSKTSFWIPKSWF